MKPIHLRNVPPPTETFDHISFLSFMADWIKPRKYLELGVRNGKSFVSVAKHSEEAYAVDMNSLSFKLPENGQYFEMTTDNFFKQLDSTIFDMVFIDASHEFEQVKKDFLNVSDLVIMDGFVFIHDTYPCNEQMTESIYCGNCYEVGLWLKNNVITDWEILTLPFNPGITILKKMSQNQQLAWKL